MFFNLFFQSLGRSTYVYSITVAQVFVYNITSLMSGKTSFKKEGNIFFEEKTILADTDPKQLLTVDFVLFFIFKKNISNPS